MIGAREFSTSDLVGEGVDPLAAMTSAQVSTSRIRRPLTPAPSEGPTQYVPPSGDPTRTLGGFVYVLGEQGRGAPLQLPSPAPSPLARGYAPAVYQNPNHYEFPANMGGRDARSPLATIPQGNQLAYTPRHDWRRPNVIGSAAVDPSIG